MDVSKIQQKYNHYTCLCFSVMGQRRFRISMGAFITSPEAGDASVIPQMKKHSSFFPGYSKSYNAVMSHKHTTNQYVLTSASNSNSMNMINKDVYEEETLMDDYIFNKMSNSTIHDSCQFPYYRSRKSNGRYSDAVLVKDVGVSCVLLNHNNLDISIAEPKNSYLVKQLKKEYSDLSTITNKITAYTKDILHHLSKKTHRTNESFQHMVPSKQAIASQYRNKEGKVCLKLRLVSNSGTQCTPQQIIQECNSVKVEYKHDTRKLYTKQSNKSSKLITYKDHLMLKKQRRQTYEKEVQAILSEKEPEASTPKALSRNTSSFYNYLMMRKRRSSKELIKLNDMYKEWSHCKNCNDKSFEEYLRRCSPVIFTNWREISKSKQLNNKALFNIFDEQQRTTNVREKFMQKHVDTSSKTNKTSSTEFQTVNIRIIKHSRKNS